MSSQLITDKSLPEVIGITGPIRAGKTTTATYLTDAYGYQLASNSQALASILQSMDIDPTRTNLQKLGNAMFNVLGNDIIARSRVAQLGNNRIIVDGIRYQEEVEYYSKACRFKLLAITADVDMRYDRAVKEADTGKDKDITKSAFLTLANARSELCVPQLVNRADALIENTGTIKSLKEQIDKILLLWSR